jgi:alpha-1,3-glucan synthase
MSTGHMTSQLSKSIKLALKSTKEERAILRARSAAQRFPVVEWRQRMEDFHKRSINASRHSAGYNSWRQSDGISGSIAAMTEQGVWNPIHLANPPQPESDEPGERDMNTPGYSGQGTSSRGDSFLHIPSQAQDCDPNSIGCYMSDTEGGSVSPNHDWNGQPDYGQFLDRTNRTITRAQTHTSDPFLEAPSRLMPSRPISVASITSIVGEKADSPLNKSMALVSYTYFSYYCLKLQCLQFTDSDGGATQEFVTKLQNLSADNSKGELSIERFLQKSEAAFFGKVRKHKLSTAASQLSSRRDSMLGKPSPSLYDLPPGPTCTFTSAYTDLPELPIHLTQLPTPSPSIM